MEAIAHAAPSSLDAPPRGGKKHHKALAAYTLDRLARWHEGSGWLCGPAGTLHPNLGARAVLRNSGGNLPQG